MDKDLNHWLNMSMGNFVDLYGQDSQATIRDMIDYQQILKQVEADYNQTINYAQEINSLLVANFEGIIFHQWGFRVSKGYNPSINRASNTPLYQKTLTLEVGNPAFEFTFNKDAPRTLISLKINSKVIRLNTISSDVIHSKYEELIQILEDRLEIPYEEILEQN
jgi:hypothetical protein